MGINILGHNDDSAARSDEVTLDSHDLATGSGSTSFPVSDVLRVIQDPLTLDETTYWTAGDPMSSFDAEVERAEQFPVVPPAPSGADTHTGSAANTLPKTTTPSGNFVVSKEVMSPAEFAARVENSLLLRVLGINAIDPNHSIGKRIVSIAYPSVTAISSEKRATVLARNLLHHPDIITAVGKSIASRREYVAAVLHCLFRNGGGSTLAIDGSHGTIIVRPDSIIAQGGQGVVENVEHCNFPDADAVLKTSFLLPKDEEVVTAQVMGRMKREARLLRVLEGVDCVPKFFDEGMYADPGGEGDRAFIVMEKIHGSTVDELIKASGTFPPAIVADFACIMTHAMSEVHNRGVWHRDIKPGNIMVDRNGAVKILDFGQATNAVAADANDQTRLTMSGTGMGTPSYMSPEQTGQVVDQRVDINGAAKIIYELWSEHRWIEDATEAKQMFVRYAMSRQGSSSSDELQIIDMERKLAVVSKEHPELAIWLEWALQDDEKKRPRTIEQWHSGGDFIRSSSGDRVTVQPLSTFITKNPTGNWSKIADVFKDGEYEYGDAAVKARLVVAKLREVYGVASLSNQCESDIMVKNVPELTICRDPAEAAVIDRLYRGEFDSATHSNMPIIAAAAAATALSVSLIIYGIYKKGEVAEIQDLKNVTQPNDSKSISTPTLSAIPVSVSGGDYLRRGPIDASQPTGTVVTSTEAPTLDTVSEEVPVAQVSWERGIEGERIDIKEFQFMMADRTIMKYSQEELFRTYSSIEEDNGQINSFTFKVGDDDASSLGHAFIFPTGNMVITLPGNRTVCLDNEGNIVYDISGELGVQNRKVIVWSTTGGGHQLGDGKFDVDRTSDVPEDLKDHIDKDVIGKRFVNDAFSAWRLSTLRAQQ